jgi:hypothetical protein
LSHTPLRRELTGLQKALDPLFRESCHLDTVVRFFYVADQRVT